MHRKLGPASGLKEEHNPWLTGKGYRPPNVSLKVGAKCDKDETNSSFYSKKTKVIVSFCARGYTKEVWNAQESETKKL